jgi:hypothetical protein
MADELQLNFQTQMAVDGSPLEELRAFMPEEAAADLVPTEENQKRIAKRLGNVKHGLAAAVPMLCRGQDGCPYHQTCPLVQTGMSFQHMMTELCPIEKYYMTKWSTQLSSELQLDPDQVVDKWAAMDIIKWMVLQHRALCLMETRPSVTEMQVVGLSEDGTPVEREEVNILVEFVDRCERAIQRCLKTLNATREAKAKNKESDASMASALAQLKQKVHDITAETTVELDS